MSKKVNSSLFTVRCKNKNKLSTNYELITNNQSGQILIVAIVALGFILVSTLLVMGGSQIFSQNATYTTKSDQAVNLAEAGVDKALASLNTSGGSYSGENETSVDIGSYSVKITSPNSTTKIIESTGYIPSKSDPKSKRTIVATVSKGVGIAFNYGVQVGEGGLEMSNNSTVNGSVYSNGNIVMSNGAKITGDAYVAGGTAPTADQQNDCTSPSCGDYIFGKNVAGNNVLDIAQSFKPSVSNNINKVALKLKKFGSPPDINVRLMGDSSGKPNKNSVLASGVLTANLVTNQYGFVEVPFSSPSSLTADTTYWIMLDTSSDSNNYWSWSADTLSSYSRGQAKWSSNWQASNPAWNNIIPDLNFKTYMGGVVTYIQGSGTIIGGEAHANTLQSLTVTKGAYYQVAQNVTAGSMHPNSLDPASKVMPISDANIQSWKDGAEASGVYTGNISNCLATLGPGKYVGDVSFNNNCTVKLIDPVWITGNLSLSNGVTINLDSSYGTSSGVLMIDGITNLSNNSKIKGSGTSGSFLMTISLYDSRTNGIKAVNVSNNGNQAVLYAPLGIVEVENNNHLNELTAWKIELDNGVTIDYDSGLSSTFFSSGPSGAYSLIKGTYQIK